MERYDRAAIKRRAEGAIRETVPKSWKFTILFLLLTIVAPSFVSGIISSIISVPMSMASVLGAAAGSAKLYGYSDYDIERYFDHYYDYDYYRYGGDPFGAMWDSGMGQVVGSMLSMLVGVMVISMVVALIIALYRAVMNYGYSGWALKVFTRQRTGYGDLFGGFRRFGRALGASLLQAIFTWLWSLTFTVVGTILAVAVLVFTVSTKTPAIILLGLLAYIVILVAMLVGEYLISYRYCLTPYFVMSDPNMHALDAITASKNAMRGNIGKRFWLDCSFLGWHLLSGTILVGVPLLVTLIGAFIGGITMSAGSFSSGADAAGALIIILFVLLGVVAGIVGAALLEMWLVAYKEVSSAGFFVWATGYQPPEVPQGQPTLPGGGYTPRQPQPPVPPTPQPPVQPQQPQWQPQPPQAPQAPRSPQFPQQPPQWPQPEPPQAPQPPQTPPPGPWQQGGQGW